MRSQEKKSPLTLWLLSGLIAVAVLAIGVFVWREFTAASVSIPDKKVHAGMYDFRKEAQSGNLGRRASDGP